MPDFRLIDRNMFNRGFGSFAGKPYANQMSWVLAIANQKLRDEFYRSRGIDPKSGDALPVSIGGGKRATSKGGQRNNWIQRERKSPRLAGGGGAGGAPDPANHATGDPMAGRSNLAANSGMNDPVKNDMIGKSLQMGMPGYGLNVDKGIVTTPGGASTLPTAANDWQGSTIIGPPDQASKALEAQSKGGPPSPGGDAETFSNYASSSKSNLTGPAGQINQPGVQTAGGGDDPFTEDVLNLYFEQMGGGVPAVPGFGGAGSIMP